MLALLQLSACYFVLYSSSQVIIDILLVVLVRIGEVERSSKEVSLISPDTNVAIPVGSLVHLNGLADIQILVIGERVSLMPNRWRLCIHVPGHSAGSIYRIKYLRRLPL